MKYFQPPKVNVAVRPPPVQRPQHVLSLPVRGSPSQTDFPNQNDGGSN